MLAGHTGLVDDLLRKGVTNSQVIFERLLGQGYAGGLTTVKTYIAAHRDLVPARRRRAAPQGGRGQRFRTAPGEAYQMDWGFVAVERPGGERARIACFAMVCHHCGSAHVEFFPNARQENLLIGMLHAFSALGVPATVLTDNMKSVVVRHGSVVATDRAAAYVGVLAELEVAAHAAYDPKDRSEGTINRVNTVHSLLGAFMEPFKGVSTKHLDAYLAWFRWCRTFMATDSGTAECTVARQLTNGVCRSRIRDMFNVLPPYMDYWAEAAA